MSQSAGNKSTITGSIAIAACMALLTGCATPTDRELLYADDPNHCANGNPPSCYEKMGQQTVCYCTTREELRELFELGGKY